MQTHLQWLWRSGVLLGVVALAACNAGGVEEGAVLESSEAELTCQVFQQCANGSSVSCGSASGVCNSGTDNGGWVSCDGTRTYCPSTTPCTCQPERQVLFGIGLSFNCTISYLNAKNDAYAQMAAQCPKGACNVVEARGGCAPTEPPDVQQQATVSLTFSCMGPPNCQ
ncbi:hypothetical protein LZ198_05095 [Myxococcus sp. K15C18031901]|uniref:hypothetical protein n=1 Tax=Myxococcus dinghuensis TaxID=2906761 RepID=UPI0020A78A00|nr:hypothetical protein [Myxococcus dinghuensis]MCP3098253.1 hypothetical protein [Myxococcus dinghuensis]